MKQTSTIENELAMMIDLLAGMVENGNIKPDEADQIIEEFLDMQTQKSEEMFPGKHVIKNILNYSKSLDVFKHPGIKPMALIVN
jgi:polyhydroxyalkanoate synthesis regulator phasin